MAKQLSSREMEDAIVDAYLRGALVTDLANRFQLARSTVYAILKRSGRVPSRFRGEAETSDAQTIAGLRQLVQYLERENAELKRDLRLAQRPISQRDVG